MERAVKNILIGLLLGLPVTTFSQLENPPLERSVSISFSGTSTQESLKLLEVPCHCSFAYQTNLVSATDHINRSYENKTVREILDDFFQLSLEYKQKGNYILLRPGKVVGEEETYITGYVFDVETGEKIAYASVYDTSAFKSAITDVYGHYTLAFSKSTGGTLEVRKEGYRDTSILWTRNNSQIIEIPLRRIAVQEQVNPTNSERSKMFKLNEKQKAQLQNIKDKLKGKVQFSVIPWVGTNGALEPVTTVDYSFNLFGGFNHSVRKLEVGTLFNLNWDTVQYAQLAGFVNMTGGYQRGAQLAGFVNLNNDDFKGFQAAGFTSITRGDFNGMQANGFVSTTGGDFQGLQAAGFLNYARSGSKAVQAAGFGNVMLRSMHGVQLAGFMNYAGDSSSGYQLAGYVNIAPKYYEGVQIAAWLNVANKIKGYQLGIINISDSIDGVPFGFFSFSRKGLHQLEISGNEVMFGNLAFRSGTNQFYNVFSIGSRFEKQLWSVGYGIGTSVRLNERNRLFFDLHSSAIAQGDAFQKSAALHKFTLNYQHAFTKKFALAIGPSYNVLVMQHPAEGVNQTFFNLAPYSFHDYNNAKNSVRMWVGGTLALRFF